MSIISGILNAAKNLFPSHTIAGKILGSERDTRSNNSNSSTQNQSSSVSVETSKNDGFMETLKKWWWIPVCLIGVLLFFSFNKRRKFY